METNDLIRLFKGHNLTKNQSIVFATLVQKKSYLTAKEISQFSNLARETIYKVLFDLKEKGLVQKSITKPKKYCSIPLKNALQFFWQAKNHQIHELKILQKNVLRKYDHSAKINPIQKKPQFILVPRKVEFSKRVEKSISESKELVRVITSSKRHLQAVAAFEKAISKVLHMGVKFQVLINDESDGVENSSKTKTFYDNPKTEVKFTDLSNKLTELIIDNKEAFLISEPELELEESSALWSTNQSYILALTTCFDTLWKNVG